MSKLYAKIKLWVKAHKDLLCIGLIAYALHLTIEGFAANLIYYKIAKPFYLGLTAA